jgi:hypothetical protein
MKIVKFISIMICLHTFSAVSVRAVSITYTLRGNFGPAIGYDLYELSGRSFIYTFSLDTDESPRIEHHGDNIGYEFFSSTYSEITISGNSLIDGTYISNSSWLGINDYIEISHTDRLALNSTWAFYPQSLQGLKLWLFPGIISGGTLPVIKASDVAEVERFYVSGTASYEALLVSVSTSTVPEPALLVIVDIKPSSCPNPLNVKSKGVLPVAILGSEDIDVNSIDVASIRLAGVGPIRSGFEDVGTPLVDANDCECSTEGPDGLPDLILKFETQEIVEAIGEVDHGDELVLELTGVLSDETPIVGSDCVIIRGKHKPLNRADFNSDGTVDMADFAAFTENWLQ